MKRERAIAIGGAVVTLAAGVVTGLGLAAALLIPTTPTSLEQGSALFALPVTMQDYADPQPARLVAHVAPPVDIVLQRPGTVTRSDCAEGRKLVSGSSSVAVDGLNILNLTSEVPLWRDLTVGDRGPDVRALEKEATRLGRSIDVDSVLSRKDMDELSALGRKADVAMGDKLDRSLILWLADAEVVVSSCGKQLGAGVSPGDVFAQGESEIVLSAAALPPDRLAGPRALDLLEEPAPIDEDGVLVDDIDSAALRRSSAFQAASSNSPGASDLELSTTVSLLEPVKVAAVPATAVLVDESGETCVFSAGNPHPVRVVGSEFGNSFITFTGDTPPAEIDVRPSARESGCA